MAERKIEPRLVRGMRDFMPAEARRRNAAMAALREVFEGFGFEPLDTPAVEPLDVLMGKYSEETDKLVFKLAKGDGDDSALRYDLTVPLSRVVAMHASEIALPWKRYHIAPVWRAEKPQRGRFREFLQCDVDTVGAPAPVADAEILAVAAAGYRKIGLPDVILLVNDRRLAGAVCEKAGAQGAAAAFLIRTLDKVDKVGAPGVEEILRKGEEREGRDAIRLGPEAIPVVRDLLAARADPAGSLAAAEKLLSGTSSGAAAVQGLRALLQLCEQAGLGGALRPDVALVRGADYYTGPIFEAVLPKGGIGSVGGGGRYDGLVGSFLGRDVPAVGFSFGLERVLVILGEREKEAAAPAPADVMVAVFSHDLAGDALRLAGELRAAGLRADVWPGEPSRLKKQYEHADRRKIPYVALVGPEEWQSHTVSLKLMGAGERLIRVPRDGVAAFVHAYSTVEAREDLLMKTGVVLAKRGESARALRAFDAIIKANPESASAWKGKATMLMRDQDFGGAADAYARALQIKPDDALAIRGRATCLIRAQRHDDALQVLKSELEKNPSTAENWLLLGLIHKDRGAWAEALGAFENAIQHSPADFTAWTARGTALFRLGRMGEALSTFEKSTSLRPATAAGWINKGYVLYALDRIPEAREALQRARSADPREFAAFREYLWSRVEELSRAELKAKPNNVQSWRNLVLALQRLGRGAEAAAQMERVKELDPSQVAALSALERIEGEDELPELLSHGNAARVLATEGANSALAGV
ncbi:MAG: histidine--tRNA ligase [Planctomycetales bacterium]|nr:histidine--tRNA ligase [Planctomycetales bacterium]